MNEDLRDFLHALTSAGARFLVVGGDAEGAIRGAEDREADLGVWVAVDFANASRVWEALIAFGAPMRAIGATREQLLKRSQVLQIGVPPRRIDILTAFSGVTFEEAWGHRVIRDVQGLAVPFLRGTALVRRQIPEDTASDLDKLLGDD